MSSPQVATLPLRLPADVAVAIRAHASASAPDECCGFLLGDADRAVRAALPATNRAAGPRFLIAPADVLAAHKDAARRGLCVLGFYHSHPHGPAAPSAHDRSLAWPGHVYVIAAGDDLRAYAVPAPGAAFEELRLVGGPA